MKIHNQICSQQIVADASVVEAFPHQHQKALQADPQLAATDHSFHGLLMQMFYSDIMIGFNSSTDAAKITWFYFCNGRPPTACRRHIWCEFACITWHIHSKFSVSARWSSDC